MSANEKFLDPRQTVESYERLEELVREYASNGYDVLLDPSEADLPGFLRDAGFVPDLIAKSPDGNVVVDVETRQSVHGNKRLSEISRIVAREAGWEFVLEYVNPDRKRDVEGFVGSPSPASISNAIDYARRLSQGSNEESARAAALLLLWSAFEGAASATVRATNDDARRLSTGAAIRDAVTLGLLSRESYGVLRALMKKRNALAHGGLEVQIDSAELSELADLCQELVEARSHRGT